MKSTKKQPEVYTMPLDLVLEELDGCGMIITDTDLIKEGLEDMGFSYDSKTTVTREK